MRRRGEGADRVRLSLLPPHRLGLARPGPPDTSSLLPGGWRVQDDSALHFPRSARATCAACQTRFVSRLRPGPGPTTGLGADSDGAPFRSMAMDLYG